MIRRHVPTLICAAVLCGILVAGLTPFRSPRNSVMWLGHGNGLRFSSYSTVVSSGAFPASPEQSASSCSLEIWLQPGSTSASNSILAFSTANKPVQLGVHQYHDRFILKRQSSDERHPTETIGIEGVFREIKPIFLTVTAGTLKTSIYLNGTLAESFPRFRMAKDCAGELVLGTSPVANERWAGQLLGLAIYKSELTLLQVLTHYKTWTTRGRPDFSENENAIGIYLLNEHVGNVVHNAVLSGIDLMIPQRYSLLHQEFMEPFWKEYKPVRSYWIDMLVNIVGFIPLGFAFCAYWNSVRPIKHAEFVTVALGFAVSLTIEVVQSYLPTRSSGTTDLMTNTLGTFIGVRLYATKTARDLLAKIY